MFGMETNIYCLVSVVVVVVVVVNFYILKSNNKHLPGTGEAVLTSTHNLCYKAKIRK